MKPTYEHLLKALDILTQDVESVYKSLADGYAPTISIGMFRRFDTAADMVQRAKLDAA